MLFHFDRQVAFLTSKLINHPYRGVRQNRYPQHMLNILEIVEQLVIQLKSIIHTWFISHNGLKK
jgi:hypothetical protein